MRDDLHKGAPVPARWRRVLRAVRAPDWRDLAPRRIREAVAADLRSWLATEFVDQLRRLHGRSLDRSEIEMLGWLARSTLERAIAIQLTAVFDRERRGSAAVPLALRGAIAEITSRPLRAMESHVAAKSPNSVPVVRRRFRAALTTADAPALAQNIIEGLDLPRPARRYLDVDADLRAP